MGTNKTEHYGLHQWVPEDDFLRTDFNENFEKLDSALYTAEQNLRTDLTGDVQQLNTALDTLERELRADHDADITQVESALSKAQQTLRSEFNSSIQKVNTTLASIQTLAEGRANIVFGTYTGNGAETRTLNLGITPKWIIVFTESGYTDSGYGGLAAVNFPIRSSASLINLQIIGSNIRLTCDATYGPFTNLSGKVYHYLAAI
ncbi:hypothetical protein [Flavonifractor sp. An306]|uniref:hypothetical protein n=1 Tax=Flavonifractor sp. An306 TaxID=1965629 RepID=UPI000B39D2FC|nr:hypothetical protein [Flavonifractor sp. An306]OUO31619.1 hypothetical protein B5F88_17935 [Flavonifractor sp. An306]